MEETEAKEHIRIPKYEVEDSMTVNEAALPWHDYKMLKDYEPEVAKIRKRQEKEDGPWRPNKGVRDPNARIDKKQDPKGRAKAPKAQEWKGCLIVKYNRKKAK